VEVQIAEDGEILVRGPNVMTGYWRDAAGTGRAIRDGWLQTGDIGSLDAEGYLRITDRKRDFIKNSGGEMISPQRIEGLLTLQDGIAQAMVVGDRRPWLAALIVPDEAVAAGEVEGRIAAAIAAVNARLTPAERIRRHAVLTEPFTVANGQMTPTLKIRRHVIGQVYEEAIARLYEGGTLG
jgi:long-chain acyl-CoA synthetase